jgi:hypothetical protein
MWAVLAECEAENSVGAVDQVDLVDAQRPDTAVDQEEDSYFESADVHPLKRDVSPGDHDEPRRADRRILSALLAPALLAPAFIASLIAFVASDLLSVLPAFLPVVAPTLLVSRAIEDQLGVVVITIRSSAGQGRLSVAVQVDGDRGASAGLGSADADLAWIVHDALGVTLTVGRGYAPLVRWNAQVPCVASIVFWDRPALAEGAEINGATDAVITLDADA